MKQAAKDGFKNKMHHHTAYLSIRICSVKEVVYHILSELKLRRIFPAVYFVNENTPKEKV